MLDVRVVCFLGHRVGEVDGMSEATVFDIETGSLPMKELQNILPPFDASAQKHPGEFDPKSVKLGNMKDEKLIAEKIEAAKQKHEEAVKQFESSLAGAEDRYWQSITEKAALSAITGQVVAIGYKSSKATVVHGQGEDNHSEASIIKRFWSTYQKFREQSRKMVGFNIQEFDLPFLVQRSIILGIPVPSCLFNQGKYLDSLFIDLRKVWGAGKWNADGSLDAICKACRIGKKPEDVGGADFAALWMNLETREKARGYLLNDLDMTWALADRANCL